MRNLICKVVFSLLCYNSLFAQAPLFYSEYAEGFANHKYIEIYNPTDSVVSLSEYAFVYMFQEPNNPGEFDTWKSFDDGATIAPHDVYVIAYPSADEEILSETDQTQVMMYDGNDCIGLVYGTEDDYILLDLIGDMYITPTVAWDVAGYVDATKDHTLIRKYSVEHGNIDWEVSAGTSPEDSEWIVLEKNTWDFVGVHEDISDLYPIGCTDSISTNYCEECNLDDGACEYTELNLSISEIQGMQDISPYVGQMVSTFGYVTAYFDSGYFIQKEDSLWSGIFVDDNLSYVPNGTGVEITAKVNEVNGLTVLTDVYSSIGYSYPIAEAPSVSPYLVNENLMEKHESCYVEVIGKCIEANNENGEAVIELLNSTSEIKTSNLIYEYDFQEDSMYSIKGVVDFSDNEYQLCPRYSQSVSPYVYPEIDEDSTVVCQTINLPAGWSMLSTYIIPNEDVADNVFYSLIVSENLVIVKNNNGASFLHGWYWDMISPINVYEGYFIKTHNVQELEICGVQALPDEIPILLHEGWSVMPYLRTVPSNAIDVLSGIVNDVILVKDDLGNVYYPQWNYNGIGAMMPGKAYQIKMSSTNTLWYLANDEEY